MTGARFVTTQWGLVAAASAPTSVESRAALQRLYEQYWLPIYAYIRRKGYSEQHAEDLVQAFFLMLFETKTVNRADPDRGRFRSYLLKTLGNFLADQRDRTNTLKRGGHEQIHSLNVITAEGRLGAEPADERTPERTFDRQWALTVLDMAFEQLRSQCVRKGVGPMFEALACFLDRTEPQGGYSQAAARLGKSEATIRVAVHRLRKEYGRILREMVGATLSSPADIDDEIQQLFRALRNDRSH